MQDLINIPYVVHESEMTRRERTEKRLIAIIIALILFLVGTNVAWLVYESQFVENYSESYYQEAENGTNHFVGGDYYGETNHHDNQNTNQEDT